MQTQLCDEDDAKHGKISAFRHLLGPAFGGLCAFHAGTVLAFRPGSGGLRRLCRMFRVVFGRAETERIIFIRYSVQSVQTRFLGTLPGSLGSFCRHIGIRSDFRRDDSTRATRLVWFELRDVMQPAITIGNGCQSTESSPVRKLDVEQILAAFRAKFIGEDSEPAYTAGISEPFVALGDDIALPSVDRSELRFYHGALHRRSHLVCDHGGDEYGWNQGHVASMSRLLYRMRYWRRYQLHDQLHSWLRNKPNDRISTCHLVRDRAPFRTHTRQGDCIRGYCFSCRKMPRHEAGLSGIGHGGKPVGRLVHDTRHGRRRCGYFQILGHTHFVDHVLL